jgi:hypothetical protein
MKEEAVEKQDRTHNCLKHVFKLTDQRMLKLHIDANVELKRKELAKFGDSILSRAEVSPTRIRRHKLSSFAVAVGLAVDETGGADPKKKRGKLARAVSSMNLPRTGQTKDPASPTKARRHHINPAAGTESDKGHGEKYERECPEKDPEKGPEEGLEKKQGKGKEQETYPDKAEAPTTLDTNSGSLIPGHFMLGTSSTASL